jgi:dTDP-glucose pyrophosphorylase
MIVLVPMAGKSPHFSADEFAYPKPLIEIVGKPMIAWAIENLDTIGSDLKFVFLVNGPEARTYSYEHIFDLTTNGRSKTIFLKGETGGALCTCLMAIDEVDPSEPMIIANSDQIIDTDLAGLIQRLQADNADAGVITFESVHPRWSYVALEDGVVTRASEKEVISKNAVAGIYYYRTAGTFFDAAQKALRHGAASHGKYYISASLNEVILDGGKVLSVPIAKADYHSFYDPRNIETFELSMDARQKASRDMRLNVIIPAAGEGSRFSEAGYPIPKPFIDVSGEMMIQRVLNNLPTSGALPTVILRREHMTALPQAVEKLLSRGVGIVPVEALTEGTACTVLLAREHFDNDQPLLIANSDQLVDVDLNPFIADCLKRGLDGSILVFRDETKNPKWSFAQTDSIGRVIRVAEKAPISDLATVGIYLFRRGRDFVSAAADMIANNDRVNGEFYTCPVYNYMIRSGLHVGVYEIPQSAMHGIGTPQDLSAYLELIGAGR